ncbi:MAG: L,D-transpeptidase [Byssovorax sp.]
MRSLERAASSLLLLALGACSGPAATTPPAVPPPAPAPGPVVGPASNQPEIKADLRIDPPEALGAENAKSPPPADAAPPPATAPVADNRPRMGAVGPFAYIYKSPSGAGLALGYIRMGTSVVLRTGKPEGNSPGCARGWYAVEPRGYACLASGRTTLDVNDPYFKALQSVAPTTDAVWYYRYAFSNGAPMYSRVPTEAEAEKEEAKLGPRGSFVQLGKWSAGHEELLEKEPIKATDPVPEIFAGGTRHVGGGTFNPDVLRWRTIPNGSMVAYAKAFEQGGRTWLMTPDLMLVPADRVRSIRRSTFHGVKLEGGLSLPLAWNRTKAMKTKYKRENGALTAVTDSFPSKTWLPVGEAKEMIDGKAYYPVRGEPETFVAESDITLSTARKGLPRGVSPGEKWIEVKILPGTLTAYVGETPVMATLFSPGKGGVPVPGNDNTVYATTATGYFPIEWKDHVATMSNEKGAPSVLWFTDVPHIQYLKAPLAMHVAYWHEDFGNPKSAECVNVAPEDGHFLFNWTEPGLPEGWGAIRPGDGAGKSTPVIVTAQ